MDEEIADIVREHGWYAANVNDHSPPFLYTIGLMHSWRHPEFVVFGLESDGAYALCTGLIDHIRSGMSFSEPGVRTVVVGGDEHRVGFRRVHATQQELYLGFAMGFMRHVGRIGELEAVQAFWPDATGKFPFEAECDLAVYDLQPRLDIGLTPRELRAWRRRWE